MPLDLDHHTLGQYRTFMDHHTLCQYRICTEHHTRGQDLEVHSALIERNLSMDHPPLCQNQASQTVDIENHTLGQYLTSHRAQNECL